MVSSNLKRVLSIIVFLHIGNIYCDSRLCDKINNKYNSFDIFNDLTAVIYTSSGRVRGRILTNVSNERKYSSFKGIPYAEPPTGKNRFKPPIKIKPWLHILDAKEHGNMCPQMDFQNAKQFYGDEDCLFLNIYTPVTNFEFNRNNYIKNPKKAVMVWIHGGAFYFGSGNNDIFGPDFLISKDVIVVTFNYRLGAPGFLNLQHPLIPGNAGLKDQTMALKWIKKNIAKFGGDSENITIFGQSAGGASVDMHLISKMSKS